MTNTDRPAFAEALHVLAETFGEPVSTVRAEGYFQALLEFPIAMVNAAVLRSLQVCKFFPRPAELRALIEGDPEDRAAAAWAALIREVRRVGYLGVPTFEDPQVLVAICDLWGSWRRLCETLPGEGPELVGWMKQFHGAYRSCGVRADRDRWLGGLPQELRSALEGIAARKSLPSAANRAVTSARDAVEEVRQLRRVR